MYASVIMLNLRKTNKNITYKSEAWIQSYVFNLLAVIKNTSPHCSIKEYGSCQNNIICLHLDIICLHFCYLTFPFTKPKLNTKKGKDHLLFSACLFHASVVWFLHFSHRYEAPSPPTAIPSHAKMKTKKPKKQTTNQR